MSSQARASAAPSQSSGGGDSFGPATNVTLSPAAQSAVSGQGSASGASAPAGGGAPPSGGGVPIAVTPSSTTDTVTLVEEADQQVIPKVGVTGASEVVDNNGNINYVKLYALIAQQDQAAQTRAVA